MTWNTDITAAPRGKMVPTTVKTKDGFKQSETYQREIIIAASRCGVVTKSYWIPDQERWCMFSKDSPPDAWMPWPENPFTNTLQQQGTDGGEISAVKGKARLENATGVEPSSSIHFVEDCGSGA
ncbi:MAG: hypothetical protein PGN22_02345 [Agrobacterium cavarae]